MLFSSLLFLYAYLPMVLLLYFGCPKRYRNGCLFLVSLIFYGWQEPVYILIMLLSTVVDYINGKMVYRYRDNRKIARRFVIFSIVFNLSLLGFFKYYTFIAENLRLLLHMELIPIFSITLPVGISFYTFQTMSYPIDIYRKQAAPQRHMASFGMFVAMFPQLVAGPIVRYQDIATQIAQRTTSISMFHKGILRFVCGLSKKVLVANAIGLLWEAIALLPASQMSIMLSWLGLVAFAFQLYFDFSGYSDMAIGLGYMLGFQLPENFNYPYLAKSMSEFWRRWHMTLGRWFRDYVYIPLGGSHHGKGYTIRNLFIVWMLTGLWHGAAWNFLLWGAYCGILIIIEKFILLQWLQKHQRLSHIYFLFIILFSWLIFSSPSLANILIYGCMMFGGSGVDFINSQTIYYLGTNAILLSIACLGCTPLPNQWYKRYEERSWMQVLMLVLVFAGLLLCTASIASDTYNPFLYFRF